MMFKMLHVECLCEWHIQLLLQAKCLWSYLNEAIISSVLVDMSCRLYLVYRVVFISAVMNSTDVSIQLYWIRVYSTVFR